MHNLGFAINSQPLGRGDGLLVLNISRELIRLINLHNWNNYIQTSITNILSTLDDVLLLITIGLLQLVVTCLDTT